MAIWFDVSHTYTWRLPQLTGIQRTTTRVLAELRLLEPDIKLVRWDPKARNFVQTELSDLPAIVQRHILGIAAPTAGGAGPSQRMDSVGLRHPFNALRLLGDRNIGKALDDYLRSERRLREAVGDHMARMVERPLRRLSKAARNVVQRSAKRTRKVSRILATAGRKANSIWSAPAIPSAATIDHREAQARPGAAKRLFQAGDICISMDATWMLLGYSEGVAKVKSKVPISWIAAIYYLTPVLHPELVEADPRWGSSTYGWPR